MFAVLLLTVRALVVEPGSVVQVNFLLPTGIIVPLMCNGNSTINEIKYNLWKEAKHYPLFSKLELDSNGYSLEFINSNAEREQCLDETQQLCELQVFQLVFEVVERKGSQAEKKLLKKISKLIGNSELWQTKGSEVEPEESDFRIAMLHQCEQTQHKIAEYTWIEKLMYFFPPRTERPMDLTPLIKKQCMSPEV